MIRSLIGLLIGLAICSGQSRSIKGRPAPRSRGPVVIELFTSEGCSSCPSADSLLAGLERDPGLIILGEHVDYWDELGWRDRFSSPLFSTRQQDYGVALHSGTVFTPQAVVQGSKEVLGSDYRALSRAIQEAGASDRASVSLQRKSSETVILRVSKIPQERGSVEVLLALTESALETRIDGGENRGRRLRHAAVVRSMTRIAELDPARPGEYVAEARLNFRPEWNVTNLKVVVLVQDKESRKILGAAALKP